MTEPLKADGPRPLQPMINDALASVADVPEDERRCEYHKTWDAQLQPTGPKCSKKAAFLIIWVETNQMSFACNGHANEIDPRAPEHVLARLVEPRG